MTSSICTLIRILTWKDLKVCLTAVPALVGQTIVTAELVVVLSIANWHIAAATAVLAVADTTAEAEKTSTVAVLPTKGCSSKLVVAAMPAAAESYFVVADTYLPEKRCITGNSLGATKRHRRLATVPNIGFKHIIVEVD